MNDSSRPDWLSDERLHNFPPEKKAFLNELYSLKSEDFSKMGMAQILAFVKKMKERKITFTDEERKILTEVLTDCSTPEECKRAAELSALLKSRQTPQ